VILRRHPPFLFAASGGRRRNRHPAGWQWRPAAGPKPVWLASSLLSAKLQTLVAHLSSPTVVGCQAPDLAMGCPDLAGPCLMCNRQEVAPPSPPWRRQRLRPAQWAPPPPWRPHPRQPWWPRPLRRRAWTPVVAGAANEAPGGWGCDRTWLPSPRWPLVQGGQQSAPSGRPCMGLAHLAGGRLLSEHDTAGAGRRRVFGLVAAGAVRGWVEIIVYSCLFFTCASLPCCCCLVARSSAVGTLPLHASPTDELSLSWSSSWRELCCCMLLRRMLCCRLGCHLGGSFAAACFSNGCSAIVFTTTKKTLTTTFKNGLGGGHNV